VHERTLLHSPTSAARQQLAQKIAELSATGLNQRQISQQLQVSLGTVNSLLRK
jgi:DNA-binding CsgD family transcriptional regulator